MNKIDYDDFLAKIYDYSPYFGKERKEQDYATQFYLDALKNIKGKVLELGTCTGMRTIPLARSGHIIDSVDISSAMHKITSEKLCYQPHYVKQNINLHLCNVFDYETDYKYQAIILPDSLLFAIADKESQFKLISMCNRLLCNDGIIVFDVFHPWINIIDEGEKKQCSRFRMDNGDVYIVYTHHCIDKVNQLHTFNFKHVLRKSKIEYHHIITYRYMFKSEIESMLFELGFKVLHFDTTFNFGKMYSIIAKKQNN